MHDGQVREGSAALDLSAGILGKYFSCDACMQRCWIQIQIQCIDDSLDVGVRFASVKTHRFLMHVLCICDCLGLFQNDDTQ